MADASLAKIYVQHLVGLNQLENLTRERVLSLVRDGFKEVNRELLSAKGLTKFQRARALGLYKRMGEILRQAYGSVDKVTKADLMDLGKLESRFVERVMTEVSGQTGVEFNTTRLPVEQVRKIVELPIQGFTRSEWWEAQSVGMSGNVKRQIQLGLFQGQGMDDITRRISNVTQNRATNEAAAIVRTAVTAVSNETQFATLQEQGEDVSSKYQVVVTLDDRTCPICADYDGVEYSYDDEQAERPPFHLNCRCSIVAVIDWAAMGIDVNLTPELKAFERAAQGGPTKYKTYESWLRAQPLETQQEVLGKTKGILFHDRDIKLADLIKQDRTVITTEELARILKLDDASLGRKAEELMLEHQGLKLPTKLSQPPLTDIEVSAMSPMEPDVFPMAMFKDKSIGKSWMDGIDDYIAAGNKSEAVATIKTALKQGGITQAQHDAMMVYAQWEPVTFKATGKATGPYKVPKMKGLDKLDSLAKKQLMRWAKEDPTMLLPMIQQYAATNTISDFERLVLQRWVEQVRDAYEASLDGIQVGLNDQSSKMLTGDKAAKYLAKLPVPSLTTKESSALKYYQQSGYRDINGILRNKQFNAWTGYTRGMVNKRKGVAEIAEHIKTVMGKTKTLDQPIKVFRVAGSKDIIGVDGPKAVDAWKKLVGKTITDKGFVSTTVQATLTEDQVAEGAPWESVVFEINVPEGSKGIWMNKVTPKSHLSHEEEFLLPAGTRLAIRDVSQVRVAGDYGNGFATLVKADVVKEGKVLKGAASEMSDLEIALDGTMVTEDMVMSVSPYKGTVLTKVAKGNPRKANTFGFRSWEKWQSGDTYDDAIAKGARPRDLDWDIQHGHVEVQGSHGEKIDPSKLKLERLERNHTERLKVETDKVDYGIKPDGSITRAELLAGVDTRGLFTSDIDKLIELYGHNKHDFEVNVRILQARMKAGTVQKQQSITTNARKEKLKESLAFNVAETEKNVRHKLGDVIKKVEHLSGPEFANKFARAIIDTIPQSDYTKVVFSDALELRNASGLFSPMNRQVTLLPKFKNAYSRYSAGSRTGEEWAAIRTTVHEGLHSRSPIFKPLETHIGGGEYVKRWGTEIEEGIVELTARKLTDSMWEGTLPKYREEMHGTYRAWVDGMKRVEDFRPGTVDKIWNQPTAEGRANVLRPVVKDYIKENLLSTDVFDAREREAIERMLDDDADFPLHFWAKYMGHERSMQAGGLSNLALAGSKEYRAPSQGTSFNAAANPAGEFVVEPQGATRNFGPAERRTQPRIQSEAEMISHKVPDPSLFGIKMSKEDEEKVLASLRDFIFRELYPISSSGDDKSDGTDLKAAVDALKDDNYLLLWWQQYFNKTYHEGWKALVRGKLK